MQKHRLSLDEYKQGILSGNRFVLSRAITLVESRLPEDATHAAKLLEQLMPHTGGSLRVGITGVPGVGKSTFIEALGSYLTHQEIRLAVLTVDPSSARSGGSILGDKTRMTQLSQDPRAFIRPSPAGAYLGGTARKTRETMLLCEAAGFQIIFVETVGVGQSETEVRHMVDFFLLLMLSGAGDELQGIKKGIMEMADALVVNKADGDNIKAAEKARQDFQHALHLFAPPESQVDPQVFLCSSLRQEGVAEVWQFVEDYKKTTQANGYFAENRKKQNLHWFRRMLHHLLEHHFLAQEKIRKLLPAIEQQVSAGTLPATQAAREVMEAVWK